MIEEDFTPKEPMSATATFTNKLPTLLYTSEQVREGEKLAAKSCDISLFELMQRAGQAAFDLLLHRYPDSKHILVCCGKGNNGGDGYIIANLAKKAGLTVSLWQVGDITQLQGDAKQAMRAYQAAGGHIQAPQKIVPADVDLIVDALLGTGIQGNVRPPFAAVIKTIKQASTPILSVDIPSGLDTDTGATLGSIVTADSTISFIGLKQGLLTGQARDHVGKLFFAGLGVSESFDDLIAAGAYLSSIDCLSEIKSRAKSAHKGTSGKAVFTGSNEGFNGAIYLAAKAAARAGVGMIAITCHAGSTTPIRSQFPEAMISAVDESTISERLQWTDVVCLGPGLGRDFWGKAIFQQCESYLQANKLPRVLDADALYFLATADDLKYSNERIITPHPGEAATLIGTSIAVIESNRFAAAAALQQRYGGIVVLKGAGTLIRCATTTTVCHAGNPGMATGGMGDVLSGVITAFLAQGYGLERSAILGTIVHSLAADECAKADGEIGMLASDLFTPIRHIINRCVNS